MAFFRVVDPVNSDPGQLVRDGGVMESLMDSTSGRYEVVTMSSTYYIDLDRMVLWRIPRIQDLLGSLLRREDELVTLLEIQQCSVVQRMVLLIDLHVLGFPPMLRNVTIVQTIKRIHSPHEDTTS